MIDAKAVDAAAPYALLVVTVGWLIVWVLALAFGRLRR